MPKLRVHDSDALNPIESFEEEEAELASRRNLMIVDGTNLGFRFKHNNSKKPFASSYVSTIQSLAKSYSARTTIVLGDKGKSVFRLEHLPDYKGNRDEKYAQRTEEEKALDEQFFEYLCDAFELCETTFPTFTIRGVEADDMAAYIVKLIGHLYDHVWLISTDGDWDTLLTDRVSRFSFTTRREYHLRDMYERLLIVKSIRYVDDAIISIDDDKSVCKTLEMLKPDIFARGRDRYSNEIPESGVCNIS